MAEIRINATGGVKLYDADDSHYAQIVAGTITANTDVMTLGHAAVVMGTKLDLNGNNLILDADADTYLDGGTADDVVDVYVAGAKDWKFGANSINVLSGTTLTIDSGATITNSGTATGFGALDGIDDQTSSNDDQLTITDSAVIINEDSDDLDFRVESGEETHMLTVDGGNDVVGISPGGFMGDLGIGLHIKESDSGASVHADADHLVIEASGNCGISILGGTSSDCSINFGDSDDNDINKISCGHSNNSFSFYTAAEEHVRFQGSTQSISLNYGGTSVTGNVAVFMTGQASAAIVGMYHKDAAGGMGIGFFDGDNQACGNISIDGSGNAVAYNTSSDYRLKENVNYDFDATTELKKLKPAKFNWKNNPSLTIEGFVAHEVSDIVPFAITGSKDATETKQEVVIGASGNMWQYNITESDWEEVKNKDGQTNELKNSTWHTEKEVPVYQTIDQSKLIPIMVKTIQELEARIEALEG